MSWLLGRGLTKQQRKWSLIVASLDTNCLVRWFLDDVPEQTQRIEALLAGGEPLVVDDAAVIETVFVLESVAKLSRRTVRDLWAAAMAQPLTISRELWTEVLSVWIDHPKLSVVDIYLAKKAEADEYDPLYTFDKKMASQLTGARLVP